MTDLVQWRCRIGLFFMRIKKSKTKRVNTVVIDCTGYPTMFLLLSILLLCGDVELNPGPKASGTTGRGTSTSRQATLDSSIQDLPASPASASPSPSISDVLTAINLLSARFDSFGLKVANIEQNLQELSATTSRVQSHVAEVVEDNRKLRERVEHCESGHGTLQLDIDANNEQCEKLKNEMGGLKEEVDRLEEYSRRENILIHGVKCDGANDFAAMRDKVVDLLNSVVRSKTFHAADIQRAHRVGKGRGDRPPPIIVRFHQFLDKLEVLKCREEFRKRNISVSNDLTRRQRAELDKLRADGKRGFYKGGKLVVIDNPDHQPSQSYAQAARVGHSLSSPGQSHHPRHQQRHDDRPS